MLRKLLEVSYAKQWAAGTRGRMILTPCPYHPTIGEQAHGGVLAQELWDCGIQASGSHLDLGRAPYDLCGVKYIDLVSLW